jgi:spore coat protein U-like protein
MKKYLMAVTLAALASGALAAGSDSKPFNVKVNLVTACKMSSITDVDFGTYTSLGAAATSTGGAFTVTCSDTLPYTLKFTSATGAVTASGTIPTVNLAYTLGLSAASGTGNGTAQSFSITGNMAAGLSGTCAAASCTGTDTSQVLFVVY